MLAIEIAMELMSDRLRKARFDAGFKSASDAVRKFGWGKSTYIAHENGQNNFDPDQAEAYGRAFNVASEWLLLGREAQPQHSPGIDRQLLQLPPDASKALIDRFNALIEGVRLGRKL